MVRRAGKYSAATADLLDRAPHAPLIIRLSITSFLCWIILGGKKHIALSEYNQVSRSLATVQASYKTAAFSEALGLMDHAFGWKAFFQSNTITSTVSGRRNDCVTHW